MAAEIARGLQPLEARACTPLLWVQLESAVTGSVFPENSAPARDAPRSGQPAEVTAVASTAVRGCTGHPSAPTRPARGRARDVARPRRRRRLRPRPRSRRPRVPKRRHAHGPEGSERSGHVISGRSCQRSLSDSHADHRYTYVQCPWCARTRQPYRRTAVLVTVPRTVGR